MLWLESQLRHLPAVILGSIVSISILALFSGSVVLKQGDEGHQNHLRVLLKQGLSGRITSLIL